MLLMLSCTSAAVFQLLLLLLATFHSLLLFRPSRGSCTLLYCSPCQNIHCCLYEEVLFPTSLFEDYRCNKCHICLHEMVFRGGERNIWLCAFFVVAKIGKKKEEGMPCCSIFPPLFHTSVRVVRSNKTFQEIIDVRLQRREEPPLTSRCSHCSRGPTLFYGSDYSEFQRALYSSAALPP